MNRTNWSSNNASTRRVYLRRNRKGNRTTPFPFASRVPLTTTIVSTNTTLLIQNSSVPINDLFALFTSYTRQYKYPFIIGLTLLIFLCVLSLVFLAIIFKCSKKTPKKKNSEDFPDFLDVRDDQKEERFKLLETHPELHRTVDGIHPSNGLIPNDNVSTTFSIDPITERKINENNPPNYSTPATPADDTSIDTLRGSLISSPSQRISLNHHSYHPTIATTPTITSPKAADSLSHSDERAAESEKNDDLHDLDLKRVEPRFIKANNNHSSSNLPGHRTSATSLEHSIRRQEKRVEEEERRNLYGSGSNLYEKELRSKDDRTVNRPKEHTNSQISLVSRTSEDSCY